MHPRVKLRRKGQATALSPQHWTIDELRKPPFNRWLRFIEPRIVVLGTHDADCWVIYGKEGATNRAKPVTPVISVPKEVNGIFVGSVPVQARRYVADIFFEFPGNFSVYRDKRICTCVNCVRPSHLIIVPHGDYDARFGL